MPASNDPDNKALQRDNVVCQKDDEESAQTSLASDKSKDDVQVVSFDNDSFWGFKSNSDAEDAADLVRITRSLPKTKGNSLQVPMSHLSHLMEFLFIHKRVLVYGTMLSSAT